jgi:mono/diheme cytochrome c family protein
MKKFKRIAKWTGIVLLVIIVGLTITTAARQNLKYDAPYPVITASTDTSVINRGKHLVYSTAHCINCHYAGNADSLLALGQDVPLTGGFEFGLPVGKIYSKNITPDVETGIGKYSDGEIARLLRYGVKANGTAVFDFMPFHNMTDEDLTAVISFLRSQKPIHNVVPEHKPNLLGYVVKAFMVRPVGPTGEVAKAINRDTSAAYGEYLTMYVSECNGCHTKRDMAGNYIGESFAGGNDIEGYITPNLTPDSSGRIFNWSKQNFIDRFRMGKLLPKSPMPWNSFRGMTDDELTAIFHYLKNLKPVRNANK